MCTYFLSLVYSFSFAFFLSRVNLNSRILPLDYQLIPTDHRCSDRPTYGPVSHRMPERSSKRSSFFFPPHSYLMFVYGHNYEFTRACSNCDIRKKEKIMPNSFISAYVNVAVHVPCLWFYEGIKDKIRDRDNGFNIITIRMEGACM